MTLRKQPLTILCLFITVSTWAVEMKPWPGEVKPFGDWVGSFEDLEKGNEGRYRLRLKDEYKGNDCAYPTQHLLPDGAIFAATYGFWERSKPHYIVGVRLRMEELDELHRSLKKKRSATVKVFLFSSVQIIIY